MKKVLAAHDLSGVGVASLTAAMPVLSGMGALVHPLPTAVLSTITGVFQGFAIVDLTKFMHDTIAHWKNESIQFDYIYSGFLGGSSQVDIILTAVDNFDATVVVDPAFGENGKIYVTMDESMVVAMRRLVARADITTPNVTEAMFLLGKSAFPKSRDEAMQWGKELNTLGAKTALITGVDIDGDTFIVVSSDSVSEFIPFTKVDVYLHGTGDIFTSALIGCMAKGADIVKATDFAARYINHLITLSDEITKEMSPEEKAYTIKLGLPVHLSHSFLQSC